MGKGLQALSSAWGRRYQPARQPVREAAELPTSTASPLPPPAPASRHRLPGLCLQLGGRGRPARRPPGRRHHQGARQGLCRGCAAAGWARRGCCGGLARRRHAGQGGQAGPRGQARAHHVRRDMSSCQASWLGTLLHIPCMGAVLHAECRRIAAPILAHTSSLDPLSHDLPPGPAALSSSSTALTAWQPCSLLPLLAASWRRRQVRPW